MKRAAWLLILVALGALGVWIAVPDRAVIDVALARVGAAPATTFAIVIGGALALVLAEVVRIVVIGRLLGVAIRVRQALDAAIANQVLTAVTPTIGLGEPSVAVVLRLHGVAWDVAVAVPFIKFTTSLALVFALGAGLAIAGFGPPVDPAIEVAVIALFSIVAIATTAFVLVCARPSWTSRVTERLRGWLLQRRLLRAPAWQSRVERGVQIMRDAGVRMAQVTTAGARGPFVLAIVHLAYYVAYVAPLVALATVLGDPPVATLLLRALIYLCVMFAVPTPGGAGGAEAVAGVFFADLVSLPDAIAIVAVFRAATFYLQVLIGIVYVPLRAAAIRSAS